MKRTWTIALAAALAIMAAGGGAMAQQVGGAPPPDALADPAGFKTPEVLAFIGVKPGDQVADIVAGRFVRALSHAVGPRGRVYAIEPAEMVKRHPEILTIMGQLTAMPDYKNISVITEPVNTPGLPPQLDAVFIRQDYHDLYDKFMGPADVPAFNRAVFAALRPGGVYVILDHTAAAGSGLSATETLHRIDPAAVKADMKAAGFVFDGESAVLANPTDPHTKMVFDPSIRGHTDQFLLRFKKPG